MKVDQGQRLYMLIRGTPAAEGTRKASQVESPLISKEEEGLPSSNKIVENSFT